MARSFFSSVMPKLLFPAAPSPGRRSKLRPKARRKSLGSRAAKASLAVMMRISRVEKLLQ